MNGNAGAPLPGQKMTKAEQMRMKMQQNERNPPQDLSAALGSMA